jgi:hypothetical protein
VEAGSSLEKRTEYACVVITQNTPNFNYFLHWYNTVLALKNVSMVTNMFVFMACPSGRGAVMLEGRKCNMASAFAAYCLRSMVQIVSMSRSICKIRHSSLRNVPQNWATASSFNALEKSQFIIANTSTIYYCKHIYNLLLKTHLQFIIANTSTIYYCKHIYNLLLQTHLQIIIANTSTIYYCKHIYNLLLQTSTIYYCKHIYNLLL